MCVHTGCECGASLSLTAPAIWSDLEPSGDDTQDSCICILMPDEQRIDSAQNRSGMGSRAQKQNMASGLLSNKEKSVVLCPGC